MFALLSFDSSSSVAFERALLMKMFESSRSSMSWISSTSSDSASFFDIELSSSMSAMSPMSPTSSSCFLVVGCVGGVEVLVWVFRGIRLVR
jgi:hypothetical protein